MKQEKKLLVITHQLSRTGAPIVLMDVISVCKQAGYQIDVITMLDGELGADLEKMGISVQIRKNFYTEKEEFYSYAKEYDLVWANTLITYEVIHVLNNTEIPVIWWLHEGRQYFDYFKTVLPDFKNLGKNIHVYSVGHYVKEVVREIYGVETDILHLEVKEGHVLSESSKVLEETYAQRKRNKKVRFLTVGTYSAVKAQDVLAEAIRLLPEGCLEQAEFYFCGNETMVDEAVFGAVKQLEQDYDNVKMLHQLSRDETFTWMEKADCLVVPSRIDPIPTVAVEMMMKKGLCLCTDICGVAYYIEDGKNGFTVPAENPKALAEKIQYIVQLKLEKQSEFFEIGENGGLIYEKHFSPKVIEPQICFMVKTYMSRIRTIRSLLVDNQFEEAMRLLVEEMEINGFNPACKELVQQINSFYKE